jgi:hypothetical protein
VNMGPGPQEPYIAVQHNEVKLVLCFIVKLLLSKKWFWILMEICGDWTCNLKAMPIAIVIVFRTIVNVYY